MTSALSFSGCCLLHLHSMIMVGKNNFSLFHLQLCFPMMLHAWDVASRLHPCSLSCFFNIFVLIVLLLFLDVTDEETTEEKMSKWLSYGVFDGCWWYSRKRSKWEVTAISVSFFPATEARPWVNWESISYDRKVSWYDRLPHQETGRYSAHDFKTFKDRKWHHHQCHWLYWLTLIHWEWLQNEYICQGRIIISISQPLIGCRA